MNRNGFRLVNTCSTCIHGYFSGKQRVGSCLLDCDKKPSEPGKWDIRGITYRKNTDNTFVIKSEEEYISKFFHGDDEYREMLKRRYKKVLKYCQWWNNNYEKMLKVHRLTVCDCHVESKKQSLENVARGIVNKCLHQHKEL